MSATAAVLATGDELGGYRIRGVIGHGGMAHVYRAEQVSLGREVALKVLAPEIADDDGFRDRFRRESRYIAALDHPHIVPVYDLGEADGRLFLAMQLVRGTTLAERLRTDGLTAAEAVRVLSQIAAALDTAHAAGIVHRDVKPQNVLLSAAGYPYLADFGIAKGTTTVDRTATAGFRGTVNYAAPEQVLGRPITPAVDIYALAAILYQCLAGRPPFEGETAAVLHAHVYAAPPSFAFDRPGSEAADRLIARGMAKLPSQRFQSAGELMREAEQVVAALPPERRQIAPAFPSAASVLTVAPGGDDPTGDDRSMNEDGSPPDADLLTAAIPSETSSDGRRTFSPTRVIAAIVLAAGAAAAAFVLVGSLTDGGHLVAHGMPFTVSYSHPWRSGRAKVDRVFVRARIGAAGNSGSRNEADRQLVRLASGRATLEAGRLGISSLVPGGVPPTLRARYGAPTASGTVLVAGHLARRYVWTPGNRWLVAYVVPFASGDSAIVCQAGAADSAALRSCELMAKHASAPRAEMISTGPDFGLARNISTLLGRSRATRLSLHSLADGTLKTRASVAANLSKIELGASRGLAHLAMPLRYQQVVTQLSAALSHDAKAFSALAAAGRSDNGAAYNAAVRQVSAASGQLATNTHAFAAYELPVPHLSAVRLASAPPHPARPPVRSSGGSASSGRSSSAGPNTSTGEKPSTTGSSSPTPHKSTGEKPSTSSSTSPTPTTSTVEKPSTTGSTSPTPHKSTVEKPSTTGSTLSTPHKSTVEKRSTTRSTSPTPHTSIGASRPVNGRQPANGHPSTTAGQSPQPSASAPSAGVDSLGNQYVFWQGTDGQLWEKAYTHGFWSQPISLHSGTLDSPPAVGVHASGEQDVFWKGPNGHLWEMWYMTSRWNRWSTAVDLGGAPLGSGPSAAVDGKGDEYVFWRGTDGQLWERSYTHGLWGQPISLNSGTLDSAPAVAIQANGEQDVFWKGFNGYLWEMRYVTNRWSNAVDLGGAPIRSGPSVGVDGNGDEYVFWQGTNGQLWEMTHTATSWSSSAPINSGPLGSAPAVAVHANGEQDVFWTGTDGQLWEMTYIHQWTGRTALGSLGPAAAGTDTTGN